MVMLELTLITPMTLALRRRWMAFVHMELTLYVNGVKM